MAISKAHIVEWLERSAAVFNENKAYLTDLDAAIGDADHGANMARGFNAIKDKLPALADKDIGTILKTTGMTLLSSVGGASGPLYGAFFMRAANTSMGKEELQGDDLVKLLEDGSNGIVQRGRAEVGDKTMIDAWTPALAALKTALAGGKNINEAMQACLVAAEQGMKSTIPLQAKKGRASYLGERSVGHQDPGATSTYLLLKALLDTIDQA
jgi:phosphoenolpyruvate---glycerone phosphotransferase subunit DhaL